LLQDRNGAILSRRTLTDAQWARIEPLLSGNKGDRGRSGTDNRLFVDAVLWLARTASLWRDGAVLPDGVGAGEGAGRVGGQPRVGEPVSPFGENGLVKGGAEAPRNQVLKVDDLVGRQVGQRQVGNRTTLLGQLARTRRRRWISWSKACSRRWRRMASRRGSGWC
jgi:hypothetical protein